MVDVHFKDGVDPKGCSLANIRCIAKAAWVFMTYGKRFTVTAMADGKHMAGSKHYTGDAFDVRTRDEGPDFQQWPDNVKRHLRNALKNTLGADYDVVIEPTHIHVEYDPK